MKYIVTVNGERIEVDLAPGSIAIDRRRMDARVEAVAGTPIQMVSIGDAVHRVVVRRGERRGSYTLWLGGHRYDVEALDERTRAIRDLTAAAAVATGPAPLVAPMPGLIVRVSVTAGDEVRAGDPLIAMEAMKMENELRASSTGRVSAVLVSSGQAVEKGAVLVELE